jgi:hypothetical protein
MAWTDILTFGCIIFLGVRGFQRGFLGSLFGPLALILASIVSIVYYLGTKDLVVSLIIGLIGPFILAWILRASLKTWNQWKQVYNPDAQLSLISRIFGIFISVSWGLVMIIITVLLLVIVPPVNESLKAMNRDIRSSWLYSVIKPFDMMAEEENKDPNVPQTTPEQRIEALSQDARIQALLQDQQIQEAIQRKDYGFLMAHPKMTAIMSDPTLVKKMLSLYRDLPEAQKQLPK